MALSEIDPIMRPRIFGSDPPFYQAEGMGFRSGVPFTTQGQLDLYRKLREERLDSDQVVYSNVLRRTGGPFGVFEAHYPNIHFFEIPKS